MLIKILNLIQIYFTSVVSVFTQNYYLFPENTEKEQAKQAKERIKDKRLQNFAAAIRREHDDKKETQADIGGNGLNKRRVGYKLSHLHGRASRCVGTSSLSYLSL